MNPFNYFLRKKPEPEQREVVSDLTKEAVLRLMHGKFNHCSDVGVQLGTIRDFQVAQDRKTIAFYREWLKTQPPQVIRAYEYWLSHFEKGCDKADLALASMPDYREAELKRRAEERARDEMVQELARTFPKPELP